MTWEPLLQGRVADLATDVVRSVGEALECDIPSAMNIGPSYGGGHAGIALFHAYYAVTQSDERAAERADRALMKAIEQVSEDCTAAGFFNGLTGVAWTSQHLEELLKGEVDPEMNEEVDAVIAESVATKPWPWDYDLIYGLVGFGCYVLDHPNRQFAEEVLGEIVARLSELAEARDGGLTWLTSPRLMIPSTRERYPAGYYNLGVAHGVPGVIGMLSRVYRRGIAKEETGRLLRGAVAWLLANKRSAASGSVLSYNTDRKETSCRSAWCYGDPGGAVMLLAAARAVGDATWEREAIAMALNDCARSAGEKQVIDTGLCHGTAGLGHLYNRMYLATGEETFGDAARTWFEDTLNNRRPGHDIAGYPSWWPDDGQWHPDPSFLSGAAGVGLALLAATSATEPSWDRPMLLSIDA